jgi:hypothetical protein
MVTRTLGTSSIGCQARWRKLDASALLMSFQSFELGLSATVHVMQAWMTIELTYCRHARDNSPQHRTQAILRVSAYLLRRICLHIGWSRWFVAACSVVRGDSQNEDCTHDDINERQLAHLVPHR